MELTGSRCLCVLLILSGCEQDVHEPNWLFRGQWIDVDGQDRSAGEACGGTFEYLDEYAGAVAFEFGVEEHLGSYRWYSREQYDADLPCGEEHPFPYACSTDSAVHSAFIPHEHEVVHLVNFAGGMCPSILSEGIAEYYGVTPQTPSSDDLDALAQELDNPSGPIANGEYAIAGRFAAYLVEHYGLATVLDLCRESDRDPSGPELSAAMTTVLGESPDTIVAEFAVELDECSDGTDYQSRVFACGAAGAAPDAGLVLDDFEVTYVFGCESDSTVGPILDIDGEWIKIVNRIDFAEDEVYWMTIEDENGEVPEIDITLAQCVSCGAGTKVHEFGPGEFIGPEQFRAGRYSLELRAPAEFSGTLTLTIAHD